MDWQFFNEERPRLSVNLTDKLCPCVLMMMMMLIKLNLPPKCQTNTIRAAFKGGPGLLELRIRE